MGKKKKASARTKRDRAKLYTRARHSNESEASRRVRLDAEAATRRQANQKRRKAAAAKGEAAAITYYAAFSKQPWLQFWKTPGGRGRVRQQPSPSLAVKGGTGRTAQMAVGSRCYCAIGSKDYSLSLATGGRLRGEATFSVRISGASRTHQKCTTQYPVYHTFEDLRREFGTVCRFPLSEERAGKVAVELAGKTLFVGPKSSGWRSAGFTAVSKYKIK
jgi:hypothetical protein